MAKKKNKKVAEREPIQISPQLLALQRPFFIGLTAIACTSGLVIVYQAWQAWTSARAGEALVELRQTISEQIEHDIDERKKRLATVVNDAYLRADVSAGAMESAGERVKRVWFDAPAISVYSAQLEEVYTQDLREFGYTRLELVNRAREAQDPVAAPIGSGARGNLGVAAAVREAGKAVGVVLVESKLMNYLRHIEQADLPRGYLALSNDSAMLAEAGDSQFAERAQRQAVADSGMYLSVAAPPTYSWVPYAPPVQFLMGFTMLLMSGYLGWGLRNAQSFTTTKIRPSEPTFLETLAAQPQPDTTKKPVMDKPTVKPKLLIDRSIFRAYDIRGVVGVGIDEGVAQLIGQAVGSLMADKGLQEIVVGRDGRLSGPSLSAALIEGLRLAGRDVIDIGMVPTPVTYFAAYQLHTGCCISLTGSHNPPDYNGFKIVVGGETLSGAAIQDLYARIAEGRLVAKGGGGLQQLDVQDDYLSRIAGDIQTERRMRIVVDCGNGVAGEIAPKVLGAIGCEVEPLFCEIDGNFPNHHPDPSDPENLHDLILMVQRMNADLGLAFDGDGDRLGVVTKSGEVIFPDRLLMLFAQDVLSRNPGAAIIYDVKCTGHLAGHVLRNGGSPIMWKTGHSLIKAKMRETEAELAGEMSGHFFFQERWFGFDDGVYAAARLMEILAADDRTPEEIFAELPKGVSTPELKVVMEEGAHYAFMDRFLAAAKFEGGKLITIDGIRVDWPDGWGLVRCSNTTPSLVLRFDADDHVALNRIQEAFRAQMRMVDSSLKLPF